MAHILHLINTFSPGGIQLIVYELSTNSALQHHRHSVACLVEPSGELRDGFLDSGVTLLPIPTIPRKRRLPHRVWKVARAIRYIGAPVGFRTTFRTSRVDLVHSHVDDFLIAQMISVAMSDVPMVWTVHGQPSLSRLEQHIGDRLVARMRRRGRISLTTVWKESLTHLSNDLQNCAVEIPNGIGLDRYRKRRHERAEMRNELGIRSDEIVIGSVGRLSREKGYDVLLDAIRILDRNARLSVLIVGDGPRRSELERSILNMDLVERVRLLGSRSDVDRLLHAFDIYIQPSRSEGIPLAVLEAMGAGLPVIATQAGGMPHLLGDGEAGLIVPVDDPRATAHAVDSLLRDETLRSRIGRRAFARVQHFTTDRMVDAYADLYQSLLDHRSWGHARRFGVQPMNAKV